MNQHPEGVESSLWNRLGEIVKAFSRLGCIAFGGPVAHLGYFREEFVDRRRWLSDEAFAELVSLCQFLPGPGSSQAAFALGMLRGGLVGALLATFCFTLPSAILLILFAYGVTYAGGGESAAWLHGLKLAAVAIVAQAVWGMGRRLCPDRARVTIALGAAAILLITFSAILQIAIILAGAGIGYWLYRGQEVNAKAAGREAGKGLSHGHIWAAMTLVLFLVLLVFLPLLAVWFPNRWLLEFDRFYRAGALVFGGGHVILPLLQAEVVTPGWVSSQDFLAGYGAAQAIPGPLFTFTAYLGTVMHRGGDAWLGGLWCLFAVFLPACLLIGGALPFWELFRSKPWARAAIAGSNAAVVGVLLSALYKPIWTEGVHSALDVALLLVAFCLLEVWKWPPWLVVILCAIIGGAVGS